MLSKALIELTKNELKNTNYGRILLLEKFEQLVNFINTQKKNQNRNCWWFRK